MEGDKMKKYLIASSPILIGILCLVTKGILGDEVLADGTLIEQNFFLVPVAFLLIFVGVASLIGVAIMSLAQKIAASH